MRCLASSSITHSHITSNSVGLVLSRTMTKVRDGDEDEADEADYSELLTQLLRLVEEAFADRLTTRHLKPRQIEEKPYFECVT